MIIELCGIYFTSIRSLPCSATQVQRRSQMFESRVYTRKTGFTGGLSRAPFALVAGSRKHSLSPEKMNFGLADMQFPAVLRGLMT